MNDQLTAGQHVRLASGRSVRIEEELDGGLQGQAFAVRREDDQEQGVLKVFSVDNATAETRVRNRALVDLAVHTWYTGLAAPSDLLDQNELVGHYACRAPGRDLRSYLRDPWGSPVQNLLLAAATAKEIDELHAHGLTHGDLGARNLIISGGRQGEALGVHLIDFDNFAVQGANGPTGHSPATGLAEYQPPERLRAYLENRSAGPVTPCEERYSLADVVHEILTRRHPLQGHDSSAQDMLDAQRNSGWLNDPQNPNRVDLPFGLPGEALDDALQDLFRRAFAPGTHPEDRPTASEWVRALTDAAGHVAVCLAPACRRAFIPSPDDRSCPFCSAPFRTLGLRTPSGRVVPFDIPQRCIGREEADGRPTVSRRHLDFERWGPLVLMTPRGSNSTRRKVGEGWVKLQNNITYDIAPGDRLLLADFEVEVIQQDAFINVPSAQ